LSSVFTDGRDDHFGDHSFFCGPEVAGLCREEDLNGLDSEALVRSLGLYRDCGFGDRAVSGFLLSLAALPE
jgi:hypothetical protein